MRATVTGNAAGSRELAEQQPHAGFVLCDRVIHLAVRAFQPRMSITCRSAMTGTDDANDIDVVFDDKTIQVRENEIQTGRSPPMPEEPFFNVIRLKRFSQQRIFLKVDLSDGQVIGRRSEEHTSELQSRGLI